MIVLNVQLSKCGDDVFGWGESWAGNGGGIEFVRVKKKRTKH
jgi:hypothetical protein